MQGDKAVLQNRRNKKSVGKRRENRTITFSPAADVLKILDGLHIPSGQMSAILNATIRENWAAAALALAIQEREQADLKIAALRQRLPNSDGKGQAFVRERAAALQLASAKPSR